MINLVSVFTRGGAVLWSRELSPPQGSPVNDLIREVMLEDNKGKSSMTYDSYTLKWAFENRLDLVFVAVYLNLSRLLYVDELLDAVKKRFCSIFGGRLLPGVVLMEMPRFDFDKEFKSIELSFFQQKSSFRGQKQRSFFDKEAKSKDFQSGNGKKSKKKKKPTAAVASVDAKKEEDSKSEDVPTENSVLESGYSDDSPETAQTVPGVKRTNNANLAKLRARGKRGQRGGRRATNRRRGFLVDVGKENDDDQEPKPKSKSGRRWADQVLTPSQIAALDLRTDAEKQAHQQVLSSQASVGDGVQHGPVQLDESESEEEYSSSEDRSVEETEAPRSGVFNLFSRMTGKVMSAEDLAPVVEQLKMSLVGKNVALEIAEQVCESVASELVGTKMSNFSRTKTIVRQALEKSLVRIVTPKRQINILHSIGRARAEKRPYTIAFIGVNGVGKSTSLAKVAHYLGTRNLKVSISACDTFRSGAVEQLLTHARALGIRVFDQGYNKDPAAVCMDSISEAKRRGDDVVLIDTAGRMQDNEPLMRALSKLVINNNPDLVLFVGEALVGNDAVDQLAKFNRALSDLSDDKNPRLIDGIILTKFDTVDDKVGAAISMTYSTGSPIVFIGTGQTYADLQRVHPKTLIRKLLR